MAKVDSISISGTSLYFYSNDHRPPHFHARRSGEWEVRVFIITTTRRELDYDHVFEKKKGPSGKLCREIAREVTEHREALLEEWEAKVDDED